MMSADGLLCQIEEWTREFGEKWTKNNETSNISEISDFSRDNQCVCAVYAKTE